MENSNWTTAGNPDVVHIQKIGQGPFSEVHKVSKAPPFFRDDLIDGDEHEQQVRGMLFIISEEDIFLKLKITFDL